MRRLSLLLLSVILLLSLAVVGAQDESVLRIVLNPDMRTSDPHVAYETETWPTAALFYVGLVRWADDNSEIIPALAESYTISDDGLVYTFVLREGIMFSNGRAITSEDIKYSFERLLSPTQAAPTAFFFSDIAGAADYLAGTASEVSGIKIIDERTVEFTFSTAVWTMLQRFALPPGFIVAREGVEAAGDQFGRQPLGAGPFVLENWESGVVITGTRNPNYYLPDRPVFDRFEMQLGVEPSVGILRMEAGEADISLDFVPNADYPRISADPAISGQLLPTAGFPNIDYLIMNPNIEPFDDLAVRKAMSLAVDRARLVQILNGRAVPASGPIPPVVLGDNKEIQPDAFDPDAAKAALAEAGYPEGFTTQLYTNTDPTNLSIVQALIADWSSIGVTIEVTQMDNAVFLDTIINQGETLPMIMTNWYLDYPDPSNVYEPLLKCGGSYNWVKFCDPDLDAKFDVANAIPLGDERWAAFSQFEADIVAAQPNIFLHHLVNYYFHSARLSIISDPAILLRWDTATLTQ